MDFWLQQLGGTLLRGAYNGAVVNHKPRWTEVREAEQVSVGRQGKPYA